MSIEILPMKIDDYDEVIALWKSVEYMGIHETSDSREGIAQFLDRNPGMSLVVRKEGKVIAAVLCGHDGRRGTINHLAVASGHRKEGIGKKLMETCLANLRKAGIPKCNIIVYHLNEKGLKFWTDNGWHTRPDLVFMQKETG